MSIRLFLLGSGVLLLVSSLTSAQIASVNVRESLMLDIVELSSGRLVVVGDRGHIVWSDDQGKIWMQADTPTSVLLTSVSFPTDKTGYAAGHDAVILKTSDGGQSWKEVYKNIKQNQPILDLWFASSDTGFAAGAYGLLLKTEDGGRSWQSIGDRVNNPDELHYNVVYQDQSKNLYLAGEAGMMFRSPDQGESWKTLQSPYQGSWFGMHSASDGGLLVFGLRGRLFQSRNLGETWSTLSTDSQKTLFGAATDKKGTVYLVGDSGVSVSGEEEQWQSTSRSDRLTLNAVVSVNMERLIAVGEQGIHFLDKPATAR